MGDFDVASVGNSRWKHDER